MVSSAATTVDQYLASLPADRRAAIATVRDHVNAGLTPGFQRTYRATGQPVDMVQSCVGFKSLACPAGREACGQAGGGPGSAGARAARGRR